MQLYNAIHADSIIAEINRICGSTANNYPYKDKVARVNAALDRYFDIGRETGAISTFDDSGRSAAPIETQNLVSGTNTYKFTAFTNEILGVVKMCVLDSNGAEFTLRHLRNYEVYNIGQDFDTAITGIPSEWWRFGDYIYLNATPNYAKTSGLRAYVDRVASRFNFTTFTVTIASPGVFSATAHGLAANDIVIFETDGALPTGLSADTPYYVISAGLTADAFEVSTTLAGSAVNTSGSQSGNHQFLKISGSPGIPTIHHNYLARYASLPYLIENSLKQQNAIATLISKEEEDIKRFFSNRDKDVRKKITMRYRAYK